MLNLFLIYSLLAIFSVIIRTLGAKTSTTGNATSQAFGKMSNHRWTLSELNPRLIKVRAPLMMNAIEQDIMSANTSGACFLGSIVEICP